MTTNQIWHIFHLQLDWGKFTIEDVTLSIAFSLKCELKIAKKIHFTYNFYFVLWLYMNPIYIYIHRVRSMRLSSLEAFVTDVPQQNYIPHKWNQVKIHFFLNNNYVGESVLLKFVVPFTKQGFQIKLTVSQIWSLICFPSIVIILAPNSTPT